MRIATWNLCHNRGASVWPSLWNALDLDIIFLQETARPETNNSCYWELVDGNKWGSAVILASGRIEPIEISNYRGWVAGGEVHDSRLQTENRRLFVFSLHSPTSSPVNKRLSYIKEVDAIVTTLKSILSEDCDLIIGGDFNFTIGERQEGEFQSTRNDEREVIQKMNQLGLVSSWVASHP